VNDKRVDAILVGEDEEKPASEEKEMKIDMEKLKKHKITKYDTKSKSNL
jgi:hypothetical protein